MLSVDYNGIKTDAIADDKTEIIVMEREKKEAKIEVRDPAEINKIGESAVSKYKGVIAAGEREKQREADLAEEETNADAAGKTVDAVAANMIYYSDRLTEKLTVMGDLFTEAGNNTDVVYNETWQADMDVTILLIDETLDDMISLNPSEQQEEAYELMMTAVSYYLIIDYSTRDSGSDQIW